MAGHNRYYLPKLDNVCTRLLMSENKPTSSCLKELKNTLNGFFGKDAMCKEVYYTINTDKLFFGACVMPEISKEDAMDIVLTDKDVKVKSYCLELDSKLTMMGLTGGELSAILLHEIGHMVLSDVPIKEARANIDKYFADKNEVLNVKESSKYSQLLIYGIKDTLTKITSLRYRNDEEVLADSFAIALGYGEQLKSALSKISHNALSSLSGVRQPKLVILDWVFRVYTNLKFTRIPAINTLKSAKSTTGSVLTKKEIDKTINSIKTINTDTIQEMANILEESTKKKNGFFHKIKMSGLRGIEEDIYEFKIRLKAAQTEDEALYILHGINNRLAILEDYIESNDLSDDQIQKYTNLIMEYRKLRDQVSNSKVFKRRNYGLWYDYNQLDDDQKANGMSMY